MSILIDKNALVDKKFLGVPYKLGGKDLKGCDCIGLTIMYFKELGVHYKYDDRMGPVLAHWWEHNPRRFLDAILPLGEMVIFSQLKKYDCLMFFGLEPINQFPSCLGVMVDDRHFLITLEDRGSFVDMLNMYWKNHFWGGIRLRKVVEAKL